MKTILGAALLAIGIVGGLYVGVWWAFIGGIIDIISQCGSEDIKEMGVAIGVVKILFAGFAGWASGILLVLPGLVLLQDS